MPMVWYIPPLSPVVDVLRDTGHDGEDVGQPVRRGRRAAHPGGVPGRAVHRRRPGAGHGGAAPAGRDALLPAPGQPRRGARRVDRRGGRHDRRADGPACTGCWRSPSTRSGTSSRPRTPRRRAGLEELATGCSLDYEGGPGMGGSGPFGETSGRPVPIAVENFHALADRQRSDTFADPSDPDRGPGQPAQLGRQGPARGLFPRTRRSSREPPRHRDRGRPRPPRCCCATRTTTVLAAAAAGARGRGRAAGRRPRATVHCRAYRAGGDPTRLAVEYVETVRPAPPVLPAPDATTPPGTPASGARRCSSSPRPTARAGLASKAANCPTTCRPCWNWPRRRATRRWRCCASTGSAWTCWRQALARATRSTGTRSTRSGPCCRRPTPADLPPRRAGPVRPAPRRGRAAALRARPREVGR